MMERAPAPDHSGLTDFARRLRLLSAIGTGTVAAGILVEVFSARLGRPVPAAMLGNEIMTIPVAWVPVATLLAIAGWSYLLAGALHAQLAVRLIVAGAWAVLAFPLVTVAPLWVGPTYAAVVVLQFWRRWARPLTDFGIWETLVFSGLLLAAFLAAGVRSLGDPALPLLSYIVALSAQTALFTAISMPLLILAGMDLATAAAKFGQWGTGLVTRWSTRPLAWLLLGLSVLPAGYLTLGGIHYTPGFWVSLVFVGSLLAAGRWLPSGDHLLDPPFPLLVSLMVLALAAPVGGMLLVSFLPEGWESLLVSAGFIGSAGVAVLATLLLRRWLDRRWPGAWGAMLVCAVWLAWVVSGGRFQGWGPDSSGVVLGAAAFTAVLAVRALRGSETPARLSLGLEVMLVLAAMLAILTSYDKNLDPGDIFAAVQAILMIGSVVWIAVAQRRIRLGWALLAGAVSVLLLIGLLRNPPWLGDWRLYLQLGLMAVALLFGIVSAHRRMGELLGEGVVQIHNTFLLIGYTIMVVTVLGWNRALTPPPDNLTDFGFLASFGLTAVGLPLYLVSAAWRLAQANR